MFNKLIPSLTEDESDILRNYMQADSAVTGTLLIEMGEEDRDLFFMISGKVEVYTRLHLAQKTIALRVATLEGPKLLGEGNLLYNKQRNATVLVSEDVKYFKLTFTDFSRLKKEHPEIVLKILEHAGAVMTRRFIQIQERIHQRIIDEAYTVNGALDVFRKYVGDAVLCEPELARKLFNIEMTWESVADLDKPDV